MSRPSQQLAVANYRARLRDGGLARFEVIGLDTDRELLRTLARQLAEAGPQPSPLRELLARQTSGLTPSRGKILAALRDSPLVGLDLPVTRTRHSGRKFKL